MIARLALTLAACILAGCAGTGGEWYIADTAEYDRASLHEHINGGAEFYIKKGFRKLTVQKYVHGTRNITATVEVYDMGVAERAREVYKESVTEDGRPLDVGTECALYPGYAEFWHDNLYVRIICYALASDAGTNLDDMRDLAELTRFVASRQEQTWQD